MFVRQHRIVVGLREPVNEFLDAFIVVLVQLLGQQTRRLGYVPNVFPSNQMQP